MAELMLGEPQGLLDYETQEGDMFDTLALDMYNEERMSTVLMQYNPDYIDTVIFEAGVHLVLPEFNTPADVEALPPWRKSTDETTL